MKQTFTLLAALALATGLQAQTTALDFTANDCDGVSHHLFADLEAGNCVVIDLVMMGCPSCGPATQGISTNVIPNSSDPSRVKFYSIGYTNSVTCSQILSWRTGLGLTHPVFAGMSAQTTYYGGMGMPTVIVLGGGYAHGVYYNELGYSASNNAAIIQAINDALADANGVQELNTANVGVSPNPATDVLTVSGANWTNATVLDLQGREVLKARIGAGKLEIATLPAGVYVVRLTDATGAKGMARFEKR
ncbi:MAG: T9SS type A sorting domain-containing protein [Flavobacteriales bacterium]